MKSSRLNKYLSNKKDAATTPIKEKEDVKSSKDKRIDQDFSGLPKDELIKPKTNTQKKTASVDVKDGEKEISKNQKGTTNAEEHDGSGGAFAATESVKE